MGLSWVSHSTLIYTSELILCSTLLQVASVSFCFKHSCENLLNAEHFCDKIWSNNVCIMRGGRAFCCSALLVIFIALQGPQGNIFHLNKGLNAHTTVWSAFSGRSSSTSQENHVQDARPVWSLSHGLIVAFLNINGVHSIYYFRRPALVCTVFLHGKIKRTKCPSAYYSNSSATFHCTLEGDLVFKLNSGPVNNGHCTQRRHASIDRRVLQSRRNPSNLIDVNNVSRDPCDFVSHQRLADTFSAMSEYQQPQTCKSTTI